MQMKYEHIHTPCKATLERRKLTGDDNKIDAYSIHPSPLRSEKINNVLSEGEQSIMQGVVCIRRYSMILPSIIYHSNTRPAALHSS